MHDELRQIAIFAKTIDHGSFKGAADELRLAPSVVSHHISQLEEKLGVTLIYRTTRKLNLTIEGERLLGAARIMHEAIETALDDLQGHSPEPIGILRITIKSALPIISNGRTGRGLQVLSEDRGAHGVHGQSSSFD